MTGRDTKVSVNTRKSPKTSRESKNII